MLIKTRCLLRSNIPGWKMTPNAVALAVFIMAVVRGSAGQSVNQIEGTSTVPQGHPIFLECKYKPFGTQDYPFWYVQRPGEPLKVFLKDLGKSSSEEGARRGFEAEHDKKLKTFHMRKPTSQLSDSAIYFCAVSLYGNKVTFGSGTRLIVLPDLEDSEPSLYQLKPQKNDGNISACLITDYSPDNITVGLEYHLELINSSLLVTEDSVSYGTFLWDNLDKPFSCHANHNGKSYTISPEDTDAACQAEFETDERTNFLSLTVLGLRIILLKSVAINLILTARFWSC